MNSELPQRLRNLTAHCRCGFCGSYRNQLPDKLYRLVADDGEVVMVAMLLCRDCLQVRLFLVEPIQADGYDAH